MSAQNNELAPNIALIYIGTMATSANAVVPGLYFRKHSRIKKVHFIDSIGIVKNNSNRLSVTLQDNAGSPVSYAAVNTSDNAAVAVTPLELVLSTPVGDPNQYEVDVPAGTTLNVKVLGVGTAIPTLAQVQVEWYPL